MQHGDVLIPVARPRLWGNEVASVAELISRGWLSSRSPAVAEFELSFAATMGARHAIAVSSGTAALHLALEAIGVGEGDEVIVPDLCMIAPVFAVLHSRATPVLVDVDATWNLDPDRVADEITDRTRAMIVTHTYGQPAALDRIADLCDRAGIVLIEDAAEAMCAAIGNRKVGTWGKVGCFSFYANKTITTGEGGMLITDDGDLCDRMRWKRDMCFGAQDEGRFVHDEVGFNYRLSGIQAALGLAQLAHLEEAAAGKLEIARWYHQELDGVAGLTAPVRTASTTHAYWVFPIVVEPEFGVSRACMQRVLRAAGIETRRFFEAVHRQPFLRRGDPDHRFPVASHLADRGCYLPSYLGLTRADVRQIARTIQALGPSAN